MNDKSLKKLLHEKLFEQVPISIAVIDKKYNIVEANHHFKKTYGEWKNKKCYEVYKGRNKRCRKCYSLKTFRDGKTRVSEEHVKDRKGNATSSLVHFFPYRDARGTVSYIVEMSTDITQRVKIENENRLLFDHTPCYITIIDRNLRVLETNSFFDKKFRRKGKIFCYEMYKGSNKPCSRCPAKKVFKTEKLEKSIQTGVDKHGTRSHYMVTAAPLSVDNNGVNRVIEISLDISEALELKNRLEQTEREKIEAERLAAVGQTVAGLSHGIKNVLMGLEGGMYVVNAGLKRNNDAIVKRGWDMLESNITRISTLVKEFLGFARGTEPNIQMINPTDIARQIILLYRDVAKKSGITLTGNLPDSIKPAPMDPEGIHICLANLVSNSIDACLVSDKKKCKIVLSCYEKNDTIYFTVKDTGCGMDYEIKKKVFTSFFTTKGSGEGTGLGLLVTRKIVSQHGGKISVKSTVGRGSEFMLEFPRGRLPEMKKENNK